MNIKPYFVNEDIKKCMELFPSTNDVKVEMFPLLTDLVENNPLCANVAIIVSNHPPKGYDII